MKRLFLLLAGAVLTAGFCLAQPNGPRQPSLPTDPTQVDREATLRAMTTVNDYFMTRYADPTAVKPYWSRQRNYESNIWTRGVYYEGLMALYSIYPDNKYFDYAMEWGEFHKWGMRNDQTTTRNADNYCCTQTYIDLYRINPKPEMLRKTLSLANMLVNTPQVNDWTWIDAIQMGMPVLAKLGKTFNEPAYWNKMWEMYSETRNNIGGGLFSTKEGLWWRDANFVPPYKEPNGKNLFWARGNGWVYAALVRVMDEIPHDDSAHYKEYLADFVAMSKALKACQRSDGFWNVSMHDESNFGGKESSGTSLFVYGLAWGIRNGVLDAKEYMPVMQKAWGALVTECVHPNGFLGYVQGTGKEPKDGQPVTYDSMPDFEDFGIGCFLLAGSEAYKVLQ